MQVNNTLSEGLKREFTVFLAAQELEERLTAELATIKDRVKINGFRPGKVPVQHLRRVCRVTAVASCVAVVHKADEPAPHRVRLQWCMM